MIRHLLNTASARADEAARAAEAKVLDVEDLEGDASPEEMLLSYVSGEKTKDRTDRELVTPWFKFLWESYRCGHEGSGSVSLLEVFWCCCGCVVGWGEEGWGGMGSSWWIPRFKFQRGGLQVGGC